MSHPKIEIYTASGDNSDAPPDIQELMTLMSGRPLPDQQTTTVSDFDRKYVGGGHGGVPANAMYDPNNHKYSINGRIDELNEGENEVKLAYVRNIHNISDIQIQFESKPTEGTVHQVKLIKKSFVSHQEPHTVELTTESDYLDLSDYRTMFVAYLDTYTKMTIVVSGAAKLIMNQNLPRPQPNE